jgi:hypothetical protein
VVSAAPSKQAGEQVKHGVARTAVAALASLAAVVAVGFGIQAASLGREDHDPVLVAQTVARLLPYHISRARMIVNGEHLSTVCTERWHDQRRVVTVAVSDGPTLVEVGNNLVQTSKLAVDEFELAGCPRPLRKWLATQLNRGAPLQIRATRHDGKAVLGIAVTGSKLGLKVFVTRSSRFPVALSIHGGGISGSSEVRYGTATAPPSTQTARSGRA